MKIMKKALPLAAALAMTAIFASAVVASPSMRYLHVRVMQAKTHELVRVNVPLSLAAQIIPAINHGKLRNGKVEIGGFHADDINLKMILDALKNAPAGDFVTVQAPDSNVRVAKEHGQLIVHVVDKHSKQNVDVTIPWEVAQALTSGTNENELNIEAGIKALEAAGDVTLVAVTGTDETVRVWIDSQSTAD